jgi:transcriptional antiterminator NusG
MKKSWYIVQTYSGLEQSVKEAIEQKRDLFKLNDFIGRVIVPEERIVGVKGKKIEKYRVPSTAKLHVSSGDAVSKDDPIAELPEVHVKHDGKITELRNMRKLVIESIDRKNSRTYYIPSSTGIESGIRLGSRLREGMPIAKDKSVYCEIDGKVVQNERIKKVVVQNTEGQDDIYFVPFETFNKALKVNQKVKAGELLADKKVFTANTDGIVEIDTYGAYREIKISKVTTRRLFPGYVFVEMYMTEEMWEVVKNTEHVINFVSNAGQPIPVKKREMNAILGLTTSRKHEKIEEVKIEIDIPVGEHVKIKKGPFEGFTGIVQEVKPEKKELVVSVTIFGRETPVVLHVSEVEKIEE